MRGDLKAVVKAILLDPEARGGGSASATYGSLKEPVLMMTNLIRGLSGITDGNRLEGNASNLGQRPYYPPTVFNYFPPDQTIQGTTTLGPEFHLAEESPRQEENGTGYRFQVWERRSLPQADS